MSRGGKRKGAGRPADPDKKVMFSTRIRPDLLKWLQAQENQAREIEDALDAHITIILDNRPGN